MTCVEDFILNNLIVELKDNIIACYKLDTNGNIINFDDNLEIELSTNLNITKNSILIRNNSLFCSVLYESYFLYSWLLEDREVKNAGKKK